MAEASNRSPRAQAELQLARSLNKGPRAAAQRKVAEVLLARKGSAQMMPASDSPGLASETIQRHCLPDEEEIAQAKCMGAAGIKPSFEEDEEPLETSLEEEEMVQGKFASVQREEGTYDEDYPMQAKADALQRLNDSSAESIQNAPSTSSPQNRTGLPDDLKAGIETLSDRSLDDVTVHYNSAKPAQLNALAYTQGKDIHVAPGQQKHVAHEAWHVVQQAEGRVHPTMQMRGTAINDDSALEREADHMGARAVAEQKAVQRARNDEPSPAVGTQLETAEAQRLPQPVAANFSPALQRMQSVAPAAAGVVQMTRETARIGTELSFTNPELYEAWRNAGGAIVTPATSKALEAWNDVMQSSGATFKTEVTDDSIKGKRYKYLFENGWWYQVSMDAGSLETQVEPFTEGQMGSEIGAMIDKFIFGTAAALELTADKFVGGGHINLDIDTVFDNDPVVFRNFLILYDNLFKTLRGLDQDENAKFFSESTHGSKTWPMVVNMFKEGKTTIAEFAKSIRTFIHTPESLEPDFLERLQNSATQEFLQGFDDKTIRKTFGVRRSKVKYYNLVQDLKGAEKTRLENLLEYKVQHNQAVNVQHIKGEPGERLELRRFSAQPSLDVLGKEIDLVLGLIEAAKSKTFFEDMDKMNVKELTRKVKSISTLLEKGQSDISKQ